MIRRTQNKKNSKYVWRDEKGRYTKREQVFYARENRDAPDYIYNPSIEGYEHQLYRATVTLNEIPIHSTPYNPHYHSYAVTKIDYYDEINIEQMQKDLMKHISEEIHFDERDFWFEHDFNIEYPKPTSNWQNRDQTYEHWEGNR